MRDTIMRVHYRAGSGLAQVVFKSGRLVPAEAGPLARQVAACFGSSVMAEGQEVEFEVNDLGLMVWFKPTEEVPSEV